MTKGQSGKSGRERRLAGALRDNLRRRKAGRRPDEGPAVADAAPTDTGAAAARQGPAKAREDGRDG